MFRVVDNFRCPDCHEMFWKPVPRNLKVVKCPNCGRVVLKKVEAKHGNRKQSIRS